jgi:hypothetical protein
MSAVPNWNEWPAVVSPARDVESDTEAVSGTNKPGPCRFTRVPTHAIGVARERRRNPRACLCLPLRLMSVGEAHEGFPVALVTRNISSSGIYFLAPRKFEAGTAIELEVALVDRPLGYGRVRMCTAAHVVRAEETETPGWIGCAASFDDFALRRDDVLPPVTKLATFPIASPFKLFD